MPGTTGRTNARALEPEALRARTFADLEARGFRPAASLPFPDATARLRPAAQVLARFVAIRAVFAWVAAPEDRLPSDVISNQIERNGLREWITAHEARIIAMPRTEAAKVYVDRIGWKLENMWPLAWVLGFEPEPLLEARTIGNDITRSLLREFLPGHDSTGDAMLAATSPRSADEVVPIEYRFYCAHNAVVSARMGGDTIPEGFDAAVDGAAIEERRRSLAWCLSPDAEWDETDLST